MPPPKNVQPTEALFERLPPVNPQADRADDRLRIAIDAQATVQIGPVSRRGRSRTQTQGADPDFQPEATWTPFGIVGPEAEDLGLSRSRSQITSDFLVDRLEPWWPEVRSRYRKVKIRRIHLDHGPANPRRRTPFLKRIVACAPKSGWRVHRASDPPDPSQSHPIERGWGIREWHGNGSLRDSIEAVLGFARSRTWKGKHPDVDRVETSYSKGVRLSPSARKAWESPITRRPSREKWFVEIPGVPKEIRDD